MTPARPLTAKPFIHDGLDGKSAIMSSNVKEVGNDIAKQHVR